MPFNQANFDVVKQEIDAGIDEAGAIATTFAPEFIPYILIGKAVAKLMPELYESAAKLLSGDNPTDEDKLVLAAAIASLANPQDL